MVVKCINVMFKLIKLYFGSTFEKPFTEPSHCEINGNFFYFKIPVLY